MSHPDSGERRRPDGATPSVHLRLSTRWEQRALRWARIVSALVFALSLLATFVLWPGNAPLVALVLVPGVLAYGAWDWSTYKLRRRRRILSESFPAEWGAVLEREVVFYRALEPSEQQRFRREIQVFLGEKRITGIGTELDTTTRVLIAASAIIPVFGFPEWEWDQINEVLVYPDRFGRDFELGSGPEHALGMVGTGFMNRLMILSKPDVLQGFRNPSDKRNVGLHEFAHLVDKADGSIDGLPRVGLERQAIGPWIELVRREMEAIQAGKSEINAYGATSETEFFAVATEYFFERPGVLHRKHPELYAMLEQIFNQDLRTRLAALTRERKRRRRRLGRNSPCPCGSGLKYKKCCLDRISS